MFQLLVFFICFVVHLCLYLNNYFNLETYLEIIPLVTKIFVTNVQ